MTRSLFRTAFTIAAALLIAAMLATPLVATPAPVPSRGVSLRVDVWTDRGEGAVYRPGDDITVYFRATDDCYLTIYDIDTEGRVRYLFPQHPDDGFVYGGITYRIPDYYDRFALRATGPRGIEYIHAVATREPRLFRHRIHERRYDFGIDPITDDPFIAINTINARLITPYYIHATATTSFFIEGRVWYPRYVCGSCHQPARHNRFDPYHGVCPKYSVVVAHGYDYWWTHDYHPTSTRFVFVGPFWRFEYRTGRYVRSRHYSYLDCAVGFANYRPFRPPMRPYVELERKSPRDDERRRFEHSYTRVRYEDTRSRDFDASRYRVDADRQLDPRSREAAVSGSTDRVRTDAGRSREASSSGSTDRVRTDEGRSREASSSGSTDRVRTDAGRSREASSSGSTDRVRTDAGRVSGDSDDGMRSREGVSSSTSSGSRDASLLRETDRRTPSVTVSPEPSVDSRERVRAVQPQNAPAVERPAVQSSRDRSQSVESSRSATRDAASDSRKANSDVTTRDRSSRAPEQRSR